MIVLEEEEEDCEEEEGDAFDLSLLESAWSLLNANFFFKWVFQTFLISLSVLPGKWDAILDHLKYNINSIS